MTRFAVVVTNYNYRAFVEEAVDSALAQTRAAAQVIVVDDGSTDDTETLIRGFAAEGRLEIAYVKQANGGKQRAHNTGVAACGNGVIETETIFGESAGDEMLLMGLRLVEGIDGLGVQTQAVVPYA